LIERLAFEANRVAKSPASDAVHDLRVAARRLDQAVTTFKIYLPRKPAKRVHKQLKTILSAAGAARDCDIASQMSKKFRQPQASILNQYARQRRRDNEKALLLILKSLSSRKRLSKWCDNLHLNSPRGDFQFETVEALAMSRLPPLAVRFFDAGDKAAGYGSGEDLHNFRIRAKRFRYTLELFLPIYGAVVQGFVQEVRSVQSILGTVNDYQTVRAMAREAGCGRKLAEALKRSERRKIRTFGEIWTERFSGPTATRWTRSLRAGGGDQPVARKSILTFRTGSTNTVARGA
jgi:CHAD domain-containing protein